MKLTHFLSIILATLVINLVAIEEASAITLRVRCVYRTDSKGVPTRSKVDVDGFGLTNGIYTASIVEGATIKWFKIDSGSAPFSIKTPSSGQAEFDFDSNSQVGSTKIPANFIKNNNITGYLHKRTSSGAMPRLIGGIATCTR